MGDYSGLKLYCTLQGKIYRINQYKDGKKIGGLFFPSIKTEDQYGYAVRCLNGWLGNMSFQRGVKITKSTGSLDFESDGYAYNDMEELLMPAYCIEDGLINSDWIRKLLEDLLEIQNGEDDGCFYDQDDSNGCDGAGESVDFTDEFIWTVGDHTIKIVAKGLSEDEKKNLKNQLDELSKLTIVQLLFERIKNNEKFSMTITACSKSDQVFKKYLKECSDISAVAKPHWTSGFYSSVSIFFNATDGNYIGYLEELFHALQYGTAEDKLLTWDVEFEAKIFLGSLIGREINANDFNKEVEGNISYYFDIFSYALMGGIAEYRNAAIDAMMHLGYSINLYNSNYFSSEPQTIFEKEAADTWAHELYEKILEMFKK